MQPVRLRVAVFDFTGCEGCELQLANCEETLAAFLGAVEVVRFREISSEHNGAYDVALVDGSITRSDEITRLRAIREQVSSAIDLIVHQERMKDGTRKITHITEVQGMEGEIITLQDLFVYKQTGIDEQGRAAGRFTATGIKPRFIEQFGLYGINLRHDLFANQYWN